MSILINKLYKAAYKDNEYREVFKFVNDGERLPHPWTASKEAKFCYSSSYAGWLMGKYGNEVGKRIYEDIKNS